ncbi:hypothetical protein ACHAP5_008541 [Fusarium lateritium]
MFANSKLITRRTGTFVYQLPRRSAGYSMLLNNGRVQMLNLREFIPKNYDRLSLQDQIIVRNRLRQPNYTPQKVEEMTEGIGEESKRLEEDMETTESDNKGVDKTNC